MNPHHAERPPPEAAEERSSADRGEAARQPNAFRPATTQGKPGARGGLKRGTPAHICEDGDSASVSRVGERLARDPGGLAREIATEDDVERAYRSELLRLAAKEQVGRARITCDDLSEAVPAVLRMARRHEILRQNTLRTLRHVAGCRAADRVRKAKKERDAVAAYAEQLRDELGVAR